MEQNNNLIRVIIFSYKNKNLEKVVQSVIDNATNHLCIDIVDKNPIDRKDVFSKYKNVSYQHYLWTKVDSPTIYKKQYLDGKEFDYFLIISDDVILQKNWDAELIKVAQKNILVSGQHKIYLYNRNSFYLGKIKEHIAKPTITNFIDRDLVFGSAEAFLKISYPTSVKYDGEEELLSIEAFKNDIQIYAMPTGFYENLNVKTIESLYTPFSKQHGYNTFVDTITDQESSIAIKEFIRYHRIEVSNINRLPFEKNDVLYDTETTLRLDKGEKFFNKRTQV